MPLRLLFDDKTTLDTQKIDIVAVHGLNPLSKDCEEHAYNTWRSPQNKSGRLWLRDDLPQIMPNARIFIHVYDSTVAYGTDQSNFIDKANELLESIRIKRIGHHDRPLILLGHSLGGLLIEQALVNARHDSSYKPISDATTGIAFFGTPHNGGNSTLVSFGSIAANVAKAAGWKKSNIIQTLKEGSLFTGILTEHWRHEIVNYEIISFWGSQDNIVPRQSSRFGLAGDKERVVMLTADHSRVCRFGDCQVDKDNLEYVQINLRDLYDNAVKRGLESQKRPIPQTDERRKISAWLRKGVPDPSREHCEIRKLYSNGTGRWLLEESDEFQAWRRSPNSFLWLYSDAGCGKSVLCSTIVEHLRDEYAKSTDDVVAFWYFSYKDAIEDSILNCLRSLIADIYSKRREVPTEILHVYAKSHDGQLEQFTLEDLKMMLKAMMSNFKNILLILDGLDECPKEDRQQSSLFTILSEIASWKQNNLHLLATSRPEVEICDLWDDISGKVGSYNSINIRGPQMNDDITIFLQRRLTESRFSKWRPAFKDEIRASLISQADGMFRLVALQLDEMSKMPNIEGKIRAAVAKLPRTLHSFYDRMFKSIDEDCYEYVRRALMWVTCSARPITLAELVEAAIIPLDGEPLPSLDELRFPDGRALLDIIPSGLVSAMQNPNGPEDDWLREFNKSLGDTSEGQSNADCGLLVHLAHFSVKEYLVQTSTLPSPTQNYQFTQPMADSKISAACFLYMTHAGNSITKVNSLLTAFPLLLYATTCWTNHMRRSSNEPLSSEVEALSLAFMQVDLQPWRLWTAIAVFDQGYEYHYATSREVHFDPFRDPINYRYRPQNFSPPLSDDTVVHPITWAAVAGLPHLLEALLRPHKHQLNHTPATPFLGSPLFAACQGRNLKTVNLLLQHGADANDTNYYPLRAALQTSPTDNDLPLIRALLSAGASPNTTYHFHGFTGIAIEGIAYSNGSLAIMRLLLEHTQKDNNNKEVFERCLITSTQFRNEAAMQLFINAGADVNVPGSDGSLVWFCIGTNQYHRLRLLIKAGANINIGLRSKPEVSWPLREAVEAFRDESVRILLEVETQMLDREEWYRLAGDIGADYINKASQLGVRKFLAAAMIRDLFCGYAEKHGLVMKDKWVDGKVEQLRDALKNNTIKDLMP